MDDKIAESNKEKIMDEIELEVLNGMNDIEFKAFEYYF